MVTVARLMRCLGGLGALVVGVEVDIWCSVVDIICRGGSFLLLLWLQLGI